MSGDFRPHDIAPAGPGFRPRQNLASERVAQGGALWDRRAAPLTATAGCDEDVEAAEMVTTSFTS